MTENIVVLIVAQHITFGLLTWQLLRWISRRERMLFSPGLAIFTFFLGAPGSLLICAIYLCSFIFDGND